MRLLPSNIQNASIRIKMLVISIWVGVITLVVSFAIFLAYDFFTLRSERIEEQVQLARIIGKNNRAAVDFKVANSAQADMYKLLSYDPRVEYGCIFTPQDSVFVDYDRDIFLNVVKGDIERLSNFILDKPEALYSPVKPVYRSESVDFDLWGNTLEVYEEIKDEADERKNNTVYIRSTLDDFYSRYTRYLLAILAIFIVTVVVATLLSFKLLQVISDPILALSDKAREISDSKDYSIRMDVGDRQDEIGLLSQSFNEMLERIMIQNKELIAAKEQAEKAREQADIAREQAETSKEQAEIAKEQAEFSAEVKQQFLASMSHEIRTPMNGIKGMVDLLEQHDMSPEEKKYLGIIKSSAKNLIVIINDILDYTKIEAGKLQLDEDAINLHQTLDTIVAGHQARVNEKELDIRVSIDEKVPQSFLGDPVRLSQILTNLFSNAVKFTIKGGVSIACRLLDEDPYRLKLRFSVQDTGIGIPRDKFDDIFQVFTQASSDTTRRFGGTGLGLSISKQLVEMQGGQLFLESEVGKGSTFSFEMWFKKNKEHALTPKRKSKGITPSPDAGKGKKVLLAEDNDVNQLLVETLLGQWGYSVDVAENGREAVEMLKEGHYVLVLMDVHMPDLDGYQATAAIRSDLPSPKCHIPIIAMTASAFKGEAERCLEVGMDDYISKPFDKNILYEKLMQHIR